MLSLMGETSLRRVDACDLSTNVWIWLNPKISDRIDFAVACAAGALYVVGGLDFAGSDDEEETVSDRMKRYDIDTNTCSISLALPVGRSWALNWIGESTREDWVENSQRLAMYLVGLHSGDCTTEHGLRDVNLAGVSFGGAGELFGDAMNESRTSHLSARTGPYLRAD